MAEVKAQRWVKCRDCGYVWPTHSTASKPRCSLKNCTGTAIDCTPEEIAKYNLPATGGKGFFPGKQTQAPFVPPGEVSATPETIEVNVEQITPLPTVLPDGDKPDDDGETASDAGDQQLVQLDKALESEEDGEQQPATPTPKTRRAGNIISKVGILVLDYLLGRMKKMELSEAQQKKFDELLEEIAAEEGWDVPGGPFAELAVFVGWTLLRQPKDPSKFTQEDINQMSADQRAKLAAMLAQPAPSPSPQPQGQVPASPPSPPTSVGGWEQ